MSNEKNNPTSTMGNNESRFRFDGEVLIQISTGTGVPTQYKKGYLVATKALFVSPAFKKLYEEHEDNFQAALAPHITEAGKAYFATSKGKEELAKFIEFVKTNNAVLKRK